MTGTPSSTGVPTPEEIAVMEKSWEEFLALRRRRVIDGIGREDVPVTKGDEE